MAAQEEPRSSKKSKTEWQVTYSSDETSIENLVVTVSSQASASTSSSFSLPSSRIRGVAFAPWLKPDRWERLASTVKHRDTDIIVSTYPKSGTTLVEHATLLFLSNASDEVLNSKDKNAVGTKRGDEIKYAKVWPEACMLHDENDACSKRGAEFAPLSEDVFNNLPSPRLLKTHAPVHMVPGNLRNTTRDDEGADENDEHASSRDLGGSSPARYIVVNRNPKDIVTSAFYHPVKANNPFVNGWPFDAWVSVWLEGATPSGKWIDWVSGWREKAEKLGSNKILTLTYEDLTSTDENIRLNALSRLGLFVLYPNKTINDLTSDQKSEFEILTNKVDSLSKFDVMKKQSGDAWHMRQGKPGNWKEHFSPTLATEFDQAVKDEVVRSNIFFE